MFRGAQVSSETSFNFFSHLLRAWEIFDIAVYCLKHHVTLIFMVSHLYPLCYNFSCFYSFCFFPYVKFCSIIKCLQELLYCFKPSRHLSLFHYLLLPSELSYLLCWFCCNLCCSLYFYSVAPLSPTLTN